MLIYCNFYFLQVEGKINGITTNLEASGKDETLRKILNY